MSIGEMQACLARLYVSEPFRQLFYADPAAALGGYRLTEDESAALRGLDPTLLDRFASSLVSKRSKRIERAYPLLFALDADEMRRYYWRFYQLHPAKPRQPAHQEVLEFGIFLEESFAGAGHLPPYASDLARYERLYYSAAFMAAASGAADGREPAEPPRIAGLDARPSPCAGLAVTDFAYDVSEIEELLQEGRAPDAERLNGGRCSIVFRPATGASGVGMLRVNPPTRKVLDLCDGRRTVAQIVAATESALGTADLREGVVDTIDRLLAAKILTLDAAGPAPPPGRARSYGDATGAESM